MLVDEGSEMQTLWGQLYATPAVAEKGYLDVEIKVETLGGHSSVPRTSPLYIPASRTTRQFIPQSAWMGTSKKRAIADDG